MARLKYEQEFKKRLEQREIAPSVESWKKLQDKLDQEDQRGQKYKKSYFWMTAAASIVAGIFVFSFFFKEEVVQSPAVVNSPVTKEEPEPSMNDVPLVSEGTGVIPVEKKEKRERIEKPLLEQYYLEQKIVIKSEEIEPISVIPDEPLLKEVISEEVIVTTAKAEENIVTNEEVDALLQDALTKLELEQNSETVTLTARDLLWEAQVEMEHSLSEKILEILKEGYTKTKTAVVDREF